MQNVLIWSDSIQSRLGLNMFTFLIIEEWLQQINYFLNISFIRIKNNPENDVVDGLKQVCDLGK